MLKQMTGREGLEDQELRQMVAAGRELEFAAGSTVVHEGSHGSDFYVIQAGRARVIQGGRVLRELGPGDFFGEIAILERSRRTASVVADTRLSVFRLDRQSFLRVMDGHGAIARKVLVEFVRRIRNEDEVPATT